MSCPETNWRETLAHRFDPEVAEPTDWSSLKSHLGTCDECRRHAVTADPSLLFALRPTAVPEEGNRNEADAMKQAVHTMRRAARVERRSERQEPLLHRLRTPRWTRWAAVAILTLGGLYGTLGLDGWTPSQDEPAAVSTPGTRSVNAAHAVPVFEGFDRPDARVYDWTSEDADVAVLMIVDENLDV